MDSAPSTLDGGQNGLNSDAGLGSAGMHWLASVTENTLSPLERGRLLRRILVIGDLVALVAAFVGTSTILGEYGAFMGASEQLVSVVACLPLFFVLAHAEGLYHLVDRHLDYTVAEELGPTFMAVGVWSFLVLTASAVFGDGLALRWIVVMWGTSLVSILAIRILARRLTRGAGWYRQRAVLVGNPAGIDRVLSRIHRHPECGLDAVGCAHRTPDGIVVVSLGSEEVARDVSHGRENGTETVLEFVERMQAQRVIVTAWGEELDERTELIRALTGYGVYVDLVSSEPEALLSGAAMHHLEGLPIMTVTPPRVTKAGRAAKRALDVVGAGVGLALLSPLLAVLAVRIKMDSKGPALFWQQRTGLRGETFEIVKFRTMVEDAEASKEDFRTDEHVGNLFKLRDDPRVTPFGSKLRRKSLDELPQLWNVLKGEMSLVGPRPLPLDEAPLPTDHYADRNRLRPGITGPWQIHGRSDVPFGDMIKLDYTYVTNWSMQEDLRLLIRTVGVVFGGRGAY